jgi:hypothetical protein
LSAKIKSYEEIKKKTEKKRRKEGKNRNGPGATVQPSNRYGPRPNIPIPNWYPASLLLSLIARAHLPGHVTIVYLGPKSTPGNQPSLISPYDQFH